ncbi:MAG TPA: ribulose-phosphate 3-epimerase [Planctomycetes bacterium]|nr:ribulose-phosphate 3-epimerase [Planctomycetota bacterium]
MIYIAPSILAADPCRLGEDVRRIVSAGADFIHCDIMDGHFVPNLTFGPHVVAAVKKCSGVPVEAHLMVSDSDIYADAFADAGADIISVHCETPEKSAAAIRKIKAAGKKAGVVINPPTPVDAAEDLMREGGISLVLCMTVNPGFGGQKFIRETLQKIAEVKRRWAPKYLAVDGGITSETAALAGQAGANFIVAGTSVFGSDDPAGSIRELREAAAGSAPL